MLEFSNLEVGDGITHSASDEDGVIVTIYDSSTYGGCNPSCVVSFGVGEEVEIDKKVLETCYELL